MEGFKYLCDWKVILPHSSDLGRVFCFTKILLHYISTLQRSQSKVIKLIHNKNQWYINRNSPKVNQCIWKWWLPSPLGQAQSNHGCSILWTKQWTIHKNKQSWLDNGPGRDWNKTVQNPGLLLWYSSINYGTQETGLSQANRGEVRIEEREKRGGPGLDYLSCLCS